MDLLTLQLAVAAVLLCRVAGEDFTSKCPSGCRCKWLSGNKAADCSAGAFDRIPGELSTEIQTLEFSNNPLYEIRQRAFEDVQLNNLKKLVLRDCKLLEVHRDGFSGLSIMIELDLSKNDLRQLHSDTFRGTEKIRWISLNHNKLEKLDDGLFRNLPFLQKIDLSDNQLLKIGMKTFTNLPKLSTLRFDGNNLTHMKVETFSSLSALSSIDLNNNPWRCDCNLQAFRDWAINRKLYTPPTSCAEPSTVVGKLWSELDSSDFACKPSIIIPAPGTIFRPTDDEMTLSCMVSGNPIPEVNWVLNSHVIPKTGQERKYVIREENTDLTKWYNLTILDLRAADGGQYQCVAKNPGGIEEREVVLQVPRYGPTVGAGGMDGSMLPLLIGLSVGAAILLIVMILLCYCFCRRRETEKLKKASHSNGEALIEGSVIPEMEKSLITAVNPVTKPPRRYDAPPSVTSGGTEMSELNKTLLDNDSVFAANEDENRSLEMEQLPKRSHETLSVDYVRAYPPDLLSFPPRAPHISPAVSSASTVADTSRLPQHQPLSPVHTPLYGYNSNLFRTLPHSRSQSPFTAPALPPVVTPRQGYVTIPRRPRVPSWSSTASAGTQILPTSEAQEPLYDNLGLRTTADGSSVLSLNKTGIEPALSPMRGRPLPATPTYQSPHPIYYAPIEEHEPAPSPVPYADPRNSVSSHHQLERFATPGPQEPINPRMSWTAKSASTPQPEPRKTLFDTGSMRRNEKMETPTRRVVPVETGSLRRTAASEGLRKAPVKEERSPLKEEVIRRSQKEESVKGSPGQEMKDTLNQSGTLGRSGKIPPRPPPKPKKKPNPDSSEPLFEDEGEDGTEV